MGILNSTQLDCLLEKMTSPIREREELRPKPYPPALMWPVGEIKWGYNTGDDEPKTDIAIISALSVFPQNSQGLVI